MSVIYTDKFGNLHRRNKKRSKNTDRRRTRDNDVISYDVTMIIRISGSGDRIWYRIWVCLRLQWEKAGPSRGRDYLGRWSRPRPFLAAHLAFLCVYSDKKAGPSRGRARPFLHCKRGLGLLPISSNNTIWVFTLVLGTVPAGTCSRNTPFLVVWTGSKESCSKESCFQLEDGQTIFSEQITPLVRLRNEVWTMWNREHVLTGRGLARRPLSAQSAR